MSQTRSRPGSTSSSLLQDVPGTYPSDTLSTESSEPQSISQAVHARRAEYTKPKTIKIKVGTWNTAGFKGTEKDIGGWFVDGQGVAEALTGLDVSDESESHNGDVLERTSLESREDVGAQEARYRKKKSTLPKGDPGLLPGGNEIGLYLLGLQEIVDVNSATEALRPYTDTSVSLKFQKDIEKALPRGYRLVAEQQLIGLLLLAYASPEVLPDIKSISTTSVGTGLLGYMGNKGAVTARLVLGETTRLVFINAHLAAGTDKGALERRNWDYSQIISRTRFQPIHDSMGLHQSTGEMIGDEDFAFFVGDLNYRLTGIPGEDVRRLLMLHTRNEYDLSKPLGKKVDGEISKDQARADRRHRASSESGASYSSSYPGSDVDDDSDRTSIDENELLDPASDPASLQTTLDSLLPHDELRHQIEKGKAFQDWQEGPITFLPTYKYDAGSVGVFDSSEKRRAPSWCDRILHRTRRDQLAYEAKLTEAADSRKRDEEMKQSGVEEAAKDEELLYDYDPDEDAAEDALYDDYADAPPGVVVTKEGFEDEIELENYTAHQRVLSSDHKPLTAVYSFKYDSVVPELKSKVHQEVVRELDKVENEGRPSVTVVVDRHRLEDHETSDENPATFEGVIFGEVRYAMHKHRGLTIANTGRVPATVSFIERPVGAGQAPGIAPAWLTLKYDDGTKITADNAKRELEPGDAFNVELELRILDLSIARSFSEGIEKLDDILVLRVENGRDHFVPLRGTWLESSLGRSIDKLIRIPEGGIRKLQRQRPDSSRRSIESSASSDSVKWSAPRELFRLTEAVEELTVRSIAEWSMVAGDEGQAPWEKVPGWPFAEESWITANLEARNERLAAVSDALDTDSAFDQALPPTLTHLERLESLANFLLLFLNGLTDGVVSENIWTQIEVGIVKNEKERKPPTEEEQRTWIQETLSQSPAHSISFILVCAMLDRIVGEVTSNHDTVRKAAEEQDKPEPVSTYMRAGALIRRKSVRQDPAAARRQVLVRGLATLFAPALIRASVPARDKEKSVLEERKMKMIELFLSKD